MQSDALTLDMRQFLANRSVQHLSTSGLAPRQPLEACEATVSCLPPKALRPNSTSRGIPKSQPFFGCHKPFCVFTSSDTTITRNEKIRTTQPHCFISE